ncbi:MDM38 [Auxenochlorella protothecoides x Auxenochlorella symbiontica]
MAEAEMERGGTEEVRTSAADLYQFMQKVRAGAPVSTAELLRFAKLFNDELTLDNLVRVQLVSLCRFVGITPYGTDAFLRTRLRRHLQQIKADDRDIQAEGLASLSEDELRGACRARGMRAPFGEGAADFMRAQLAEWLDWSLNRSLPSSLLLLSRAFTVTSPLSGGRRGVDEDMLRSTLGSLPDEVVEDVELFATRDGDDKTEAYERKLELLEREEEMIKEEEEAAVAAETPITSGAQTAQELTAAVAAAAVVREAAASAMVDVLEGVSEEEKAAKYAEARRSKMRKVVNALAALASSSGVAGERTAFMELVEKEIGRLESNLTKRGGGMVFTRGALASSRQAALEGMVGESRLADKVASILGRVEAELDAADAHIGNRLHVLDLDQDGVISVEELQTALSFLREQVGEEELRHMLQVLSREAGTDGAIDVNKLMEMAKREDDEDDDK